MDLTLVRHATLLLHYAGRRILVDPLLSAAGTLPPMSPAADERPNPLVPLGVGIDDLLAGLDALMVTHTHSDHLDEEAKSRVPKDVALFCQPADEGPLTDAGFSRLYPLHDPIDWADVVVSRTGGRHGHGEMAERMGPVSGFVLEAEGEPTLYIAGDTVWTEEVEEALQRHRPAVVVLNAGAAQFTEGGPITMTPDDVLATARAAGSARIVAVHMEAINHCVSTRADLRAAVVAAGSEEPLVFAPEDGERLTFTAG